MAPTTFSRAPDLWPIRLRAWGGGLLFLLLYVLAARFHLREAAALGAPPPIWLPAGISLAALIVLGRAGLPWVALAATLAYAPIWLAPDLALPQVQRWLHLLVAVALETTQAALAWRLWRRFVPRGIQDWGAVLRFTALVAITPALLLAPLLALNWLGAEGWASLGLRQVIAYAAIATLGHILGILLVVPTLQAWREEGWPPRDHIASALFGLALLILVQFAAFRLYPDYIYLTVPILLLFALFSGARLAMVATLLLVVGTAEATAAQAGPFAAGSGVTYLPLLIYLLVLVIISLVGRVQYGDVLRRQRELEKAVAARTTELRQEVAARTAAAEAALAGERRFRALLDKAQDGIALFDRSGRVIAIGASAISRNQTTPAADSAVIQRYIHPADWEAAAAAFTQVAAAPGKTFIHSARVRNPQGDYVWLEGAATNLLDDPAVAAIVVNYRDISERKRAEEQTAYQALLFGHLSDAVIATDLALNVRTWNQAAEAIYGWTAAEAVGRPLVELTRLQQAPGSREQLMEILLTAGVWKGEVTQLHRDGHAISIFAAVSLVRDADGQPAGIVAVNRDMTEQRRAWQALEEERALLAERVAEGTAELRQANHELQAAAQAKDEFIASVSHELRTPLNTILILTELLELETAGPLTTKQRTHLHTLRSNGQHLLRLINDILDFAKLQANRLAVDCAPVGVVEVCQASLSMVTAQAEHKRLQVSFTPDPAAGIVRADAQRTRQILVNLLGNAVKFTPEGGAIGLQVQADATAGRLRFTVWDTGIGIAAADFERLFEPFVQLESGLARRYEGTGLGLPLAAQLARLQGGGVEVQSEQGKGSAFTLWLPWG